MLLEEVVGAVESRSGQPFRGFPSRTSELRYSRSPPVTRPLCPPPLALE